VVAQLNVLLSAIPPQITLSDAEAREHGQYHSSDAIDSHQQPPLSPHVASDYVLPLPELQRYASSRRAISAAYSSAATLDNSTAYRRVFDVLSPLSSTSPPPLCGEEGDHATMGPPAASLQKVLAERAVLAEALARVVLRPAADAVLRLDSVAKQTQRKNDGTNPLCIMSAIDLSIMTVASPQSQPQLSFALNLARPFTGVSTKQTSAGGESAARFFTSVGYLRTCYSDGAADTTTDLPAMDVFIDDEFVLTRLNSLLEKATVRTSAELFVVQLERLIATALTELTASQLGQPADGGYLLHG